MNYICKDQVVILVQHYDEFVIVALLIIAMDFLHIGKIATFIPPTIGLLSTSLFGSMASTIRGY
jgi:hypothetical protein